MLPFLPPKIHSHHTVSGDKGLCYQVGQMQGKGSRVANGDESLPMFAPGYWGMERPGANSPESFRMLVFLWGEIT